MESDDLLLRMKMLVALMGDPRPRATVQEAMTEIQRLRAAAVKRLNDEFGA